MKSPDPNVMRAVFNDPEALRRISDIMSAKDTKDRTVTVGGKSYIVRTSSDKKQRD